jgi:two-component system, NarL family, sensor histidine kinase UhpB
MSLRTRLMWSVVFALIIGLGLGGVMTIWQARQSVASEVGSAFTVGRQTLAAAIESGSPAPDPHRLIAEFDGNRHIRASLIGADGNPVASSTLAPTAEPAPAWFIGLIGVPARVEQIGLPPASLPVRAIRLETDPRNEVLEVWNSLRDTAILIAALALSAGLLMWWSITRVLRPLAALSAALHSVGAGEFEARLAADGLPETKVIATAFNRMAQDLSLAREHNRALYRQLLTAQEAERADIARDLHDDIGPLLLALNIDLAGVADRFAAGETAAVPAALGAMGETIGQAQRQIRAIVNRLRPIGLAEFGLRRAVETLVEFWQRRNPAVAFSLDLPEALETLGELADITAFRVVQEALNNALRHGKPTHIGISFRLDTPSSRDLTLQIVDDGTGGAESKPGFGLTGMQERIEAAGGRLSVVAGTERGFTVTATLPMSDRAAAAPEPITEEVP